MAFSDSVKLCVKRRSHFQCCLCRGLGVEVHHIIPKEESGPDTDANAAPLCPSCHETYGANPQKRKFIREARDFWYELCEKQSACDADRLERIEELLEGVATKNDIDKFVRDVRSSRQCIESAVFNVIERDRFVLQIDQLHRRVREVEEDLSKKKESVSQSRSQLALVQLGCEMAERIAGGCSDTYGSEAAGAFGKVVQSLHSLGYLNEDAVHKTLTAALAGGPIPQDTAERIIYYSAQQLKGLIQFDAVLALAASLVPLLLEEYRRQPNRSASEIIEPLVQRMRSGEILEELSTRGRSDPGSTTVIPSQVASPH
jgi:hypothetical protein